jgi:hypothetical protein
VARSADDDERCMWVKEKPLLFLFGGHGQAELVDGVLESLLIQKQFSTGETHETPLFRSVNPNLTLDADASDLLIVVWLGSIREVLQDPSERDHTLPNLANLVLADSLLNVREHEVLIEFTRLVVIGGSLGVLRCDEVD